MDTAQQVTVEFHISPLFRWLYFNPLVFLCSTFDMEPNRDRMNFWFKKFVRMRRL